MTMKKYTRKPIKAQRRQQRRDKAKRQQAMA